MTSNEVIKKLFRELQETKRKNEILKEKIKTLEQNNDETKILKRRIKILEQSLNEKERQCNELMNTIELLVGSDII